MSKLNPLKLLKFDDIYLNDGLEKRDKLLGLLQKWVSCFAESSNELGTIKCGEMKIDLLKDAKPWTFGRIENPLRCAVYHSRIRWTCKKCRNKIYVEKNVFFFIFGQKWVRIEY